MTASMRTVITRPVSSVASRIAPMRSGEVSTRESGMLTRNNDPTTSSDGALAASCAKAGYKAAASNANSKRANDPTKLFNGSSPRCRQAMRDALPEERWY